MSTIPPLGSATVSLLRPPYTKVEPLTTPWTPEDWPQPGLGLVWSLHTGDPAREFEWIRDRPPGLPLFVVLPPPERLAPIAGLLSRVTQLSPRAVLPFGPLASPETIKFLLGNLRRPVASFLLTYLGRRGLVPPECRNEIARTLEVAPTARSITALCKKIYISRRTLGRHFEMAGIPAPSHWLQMSRLLHAAARLQKDQAPVFRAASHAGYPDAFTLSNQMKRLLGVRPTVARESLGLEWLVESWVRTECERGGFYPVRFADALSHYLDRPPSNG